MRGFFRGWRRKLGCVTLLLACVVTGWWIRSFYICDDIRVPGRTPAFHLFFTLPNWFGWVWVENADGGVPPRYRSGKTAYSTTVHEYSYRPYRFVYGNVDPKHPLAQTMEAGPHFYLSYWMVVLPLTLLSAYLLLSKPRLRKTAPMMHASNQT